MKTAKVDRPQGLGVGDATLLVVGSVVGVGIFFTPQEVAAQVSGPGAYMATWALAGLITLLGCFTVAELASMYPRAGGGYVYLLELVGRRWAFLFGWTGILVGTTAGIAVVGDFFARQVVGAVPAAASIPHAALALGLIWFLALLCASGVKVGARFQSVCMSLKLGAILVLLGAGWMLVMGPPAAELASTGGAGASGAADAATGGSSGAFSGIARGLLPAFFAYFGWSNISTITSELRTPHRTLPRAIVAGVLIVIALYLALGATYVRVLGFERLATDPGFAAETARLSLGTAAGGVFQLGLAFSALGVMLAGILVSPWLYVAMARSGDFFASLGWTHPRTHAPIPATAVQAVGATAWFLYGDTGLAIEAVSYVTWILDVVMVGGLVWAIRSRLDLERPYVSPLDPWIPSAYLVISALLLVVVTLSASRELLVGAGLMFASGFAVYTPWRRWVVRSAG